MAEKKIAVLGAGSWGTALALALARNQHQVTLWTHRLEHAQQLRAQNSNQRYLPDVAFPENLLISDDLASLGSEHHYFLIVVPSTAFRATLKKLKASNISDNATIIGATKGFDKGDGYAVPQLLSEVVKQELGEQCPYVLITGPSFSKEVANNLPTAMTAAGTQTQITQQVAGLFHGGNIRVYNNHDLIGAQLGGAVKNVMAIAAGISDGLGFGANARAAIITRGIAEITRLAMAMGANEQTLTGLAGLGDLVLTCTDNQSRNRRFGLAIGQQIAIEQALESIAQEVEGISSTKETIKLAEYFNVEMPITEQVANVLFKQSTPEQAVKQLLIRNQIRE